MSYATAHALRTALEDRIHNWSTTTGISLDRLRRRVLFERIVARLQASAPGRWVLKGGMALEVRLGDEARLTKDLDLGLRSEIESSTALHELLIEALSVDREGDRFEFAAAAPQLLASDGAGHPTWRVSVAARLAGRNFGGIRLDVSPRPHELVETEEVVLPNTLDFAGIPATTIEMVDVNRHAAEKLHAMSRDFGARENTRVRDLVDVVLLIEHGLLTTERLRACVREVWTERDRTDPPTELPAFPASWPMRYQRLTTEHGVGASDFPSARAQIERLWSDLR
jgi:predicted nucleotidyltransferase component of viral defense system